MSAIPDEINHQISRLWLAVWLMPIAICATAILWQIGQLRPEVIEAQSFKLIDANGRELARLNAVAGGVVVALWDSGAPTVKWLLKEDGPEVLVPDGVNVRSGIASEHSGHVVAVSLPPGAAVAPLSPAQ